MCWGLLHILLTTRTRWHHHPPLTWSTARAFAGQDREDLRRTLPTLLLRSVIRHPACSGDRGQGMGLGDRAVLSLIHI